MNVKNNESFFMDNFFKPRSVMIIGASNTPGNLGAPICQSLASLGYHGTVMVVNRKGESVCGCPGYRSVSDVPSTVDLAVILAPAHTVPGIMRECGEKGIASVIIETAGFGELGDEGRRLQDEINRMAITYNIRFIGPNCIGTMDSHSRFTSFFGVRPGIFDELFKSPGETAIVTQSGGVGTLALRSLMTDVVSFSKIISIGNRADIDESDMISYLNNDPLTSVICMYLENIDKGRKLMQAASETRKPLMVFKAGTTIHGSRAAASHTAGMANNDIIFDSACRQAGIIRLKSVTELYSMPKMFITMPVLKGKRTVVITNTGAFGTILSDMLATSGMTPAVLSRSLQLAINNAGTVFNAANPIDLGPGMSGETFLTIFKLLLESDEVDGLVLAVNVWQQFIIDAIISMTELCRDYGKPAAIYTPNSIERILELRKKFSIPVFETPEEAVRALVLSHQYYQICLKKNMADQRLNSNN
ncbi:MAG TPA: CoA-binding protein [Spirochaetota bacterium]|nr:CoA-binding protein [Spirochaetota bacterium]HPI89371.1 CoA-binding protein [Spirochaetota bacterium]